MTIEGTPFTIEDLRKLTATHSPLTYDNYTKAFALALAHVDEAGLPTGNIPRWFVVPPQLHMSGKRIESDPMIQGTIELMVVPALGNRAKRWYIVGPHAAVAMDGEAP